MGNSLMGKFYNQKMNHPYPLFVTHSVMPDSLRPHRLVACQAPLSKGFPRQEYWSGFPLSSLGDLPDPGIKAGSPAFQADSLLAEPIP